MNMTRIVSSRLGCNKFFMNFHGFVLANAYTLIHNACFVTLVQLFPSLTHSLFFSFHIVSVLLAVLSKPAMNEIFLVLVSYVIIITFLAIEICLFFAAGNR